LTPIQSRSDMAYQRLSIAELSESRAWGNTDGTHAKPQAVQLAARIELGEYLLSLPTERRGGNPPTDATLIDGLERLRERLARVQTDPRDREFCRIWREAYDEWLLAVDEVLFVERMEDGERETESRLPGLTA